MLKVTTPASAREKSLGKFRCSRNLSGAGRTVASSMTTGFAVAARPAVITNSPVSARALMNRESRGDSNVSACVEVMNAVQPPPCIGQRTP